MSVLGQIISTTFASAASPPTYDPYYANVSLLLHADGTNGSTSFPDNSPNPKTVTAADGASITTSIFKFGGGSGNFPGSARLALPLTNDLVLDGDFTIECWLYQTGTTRKVVIGSNLSVTNNQIQFNQAGLNTGLYNGVGWQSLNLISSPTNTWIFMVYQRLGTTITIYQNGTSLGTFTSGSTYNFSSGAIGGLQNYAGDEWVGYIDDFRVTKGVARYTSNFTPPTEPFPNSGPPVTSQTFSYTGATQTFTVPTGVTLINVSMWGGGGASNNVSDGAAAKGGAGGFVKFTIAVTPGESLTVNVGGKGSMPVIQYRQPGGAGGMSALLRSATYLGISGGGGGGGGYGNSNTNSWGGSGGGTTANSGGDASVYSTGGGGGTQSAGGTGGTPGPGQNGASLQGGNGSGSNLTTLGGWPNGGNASTDQEHGGGGGGGYYGGGGGGGAGTWGAGGGGGSSYTDPAATSVTHIKSAANDNSAPGTAETGYVTGVALGGFQTTNPGNGLVYISW